MQFQTDDVVVYPGYGVGRIVGLVKKRFFEDEARMYYELAIDNSTVWVPLNTETAGELRPLTPKKELDYYRRVLTSEPGELDADPRQRRSDILSRLKVGSFQDMCEVVRDLTARSWQKPLGESDSAALRKARDGLCAEWAAVDGVSVLEAAQLVDELLLETRRVHEAGESPG